MATPLHRHRASLEGVIDFTVPNTVFQNNEERAEAELLFTTLLRHFASPDMSAQHPELAKPYLRLELVRLIHSYAAAGVSKDLFLQAFFLNIEVDASTTFEQIDAALVAEKIIIFTDWLLENFFLPRKDSLSPFFVNISKAMLKQNTNTYSESIFRQNTATYTTTHAAVTVYTSSRS
ncbi:hypothetical protein SPI_08445 [Niveomyces insectorum RCEF 264]|uniref:Uncharacterized protein n=1 Tax=Niveomyces insectorum RCEF 264 TaxID=1081102 RepID=A0A162MF98_9HYPO|nr:hypothetical protein SPI_08445 [Niveomyces insectorum RCEF 264]